MSLVDPITEVESWNPSAFDTASVLVQRAVNGKDYFEPFLHYSQLWAYCIRNKYTSIFRFAAWGLIIVRIYERPLWTYEENYCSDWLDGSKFPTFSASYFYITEASSRYISIALLMVILWAIVLEVTYSAYSSSISLDNLRKIFHWPLLCCILCWILKFAEITSYFTSPSASESTYCNSKTVFSTSPVEAFFLVFIEKSYSTLIASLIARILPTFSLVMITLICIVSVYTALGLMIFNPDSQQGQLYFSSYEDALWTMIMVMTANMWPTAMIPAFESHRINFLYYVVFVIVVDWLLLNRATAIVLYYFRVQSTVSKQQLDMRQNENLQITYRVLCEYCQLPANHPIPGRVFGEFIQHYVRNFRISYSEIKCLDKLKNKTIDEAEFKLFFLSLCDGISIKGSLEPFVSPYVPYREDSVIYSPFQDSSMEQTPDITDSEQTTPTGKIFSRKQKELQKFVCDIIFSILLIIYVSVGYSSCKLTITIHLISIFELVQFILEPVFQIYGETIFKHMKMYMFTHFFVFLAYLIFCISPSIPEQTFFLVACSLRFVLTFRSLPVFFSKIIAFLFAFQRVMNKILGYKETSRFRDSNLKSFFDQLFYALNFHRVLKKMSFVRDFSFILVLMFIFGYSFASIGVTSFGGVIKYPIVNSTDVSSSILGTNYAESEYWPLNFNDFLSGLVTIFVLLIVNNMNVITEGIESNFTSLGMRFACKLFILSWYMMGVLLLLNILLSFIVLEVEKATSLTVENKAEVTIHEDNESLNSSRLSDERISRSISYAPENDRSASVVLFDSVIERQKSIGILNFEGPTEKQINESAAAFIHYAKTGTDKAAIDLIPILSTKWGATCFAWHMKMEGFFTIAAYSLIFLSIFQRPLWSFDESLSKNIEYTWDDSTFYPSYYLPVMTPLESALLVLLLEGVLMLGVFLELGYKVNLEDMKLAESKESKIKTFLSYLGIHGHLKFTVFFRPVIILMLIINILILFTGLLKHSAGYNVDRMLIRGITLSSFLSLVLVFWFDKQADVIFRQVLGILPRFSALLFLFLFAVLMFGFVGFILFGRDDAQVFSITADVHDANPLDNLQYFGTILRSFWTVFVAMTSSSWPNQLIPSYTESRLSVLYFIAFISIGTFGILGVISAYVIVDYTNISRSIALKMSENRDAALRSAFDIADVHKRGWLDYMQMSNLLNELFLNHGSFRQKHANGLLGSIGAALTGGYITQPPSGNKMRLIIAALDINSDGKIYFEQFSNILVILDMNIVLNYHNRLRGSIFIAEMLKSHNFTVLEMNVENGRISFLFETLVMITIIIGFCLGPSIYEQTTTTKYMISVSAAIASIGVIFRVLVLGLRRYMQTGWHQLEVIVILIFQIIVLVDDAKTIDSFSDRTIKVIIFLWMFFYMRHALLLLPTNMRVALKDEAIFIALNSRYVFLIFLIFGFAFALVGVLMFGGKVTLDPENVMYSSLVDSQYYKSGFLSINFNDIPSAMTTLFVCLRVSNFDVIADGMVAVSNIFVRLYFVLWYIVGVLLFLNIIKSLFIRSVLYGKYINHDTVDCDDDFPHDPRTYSRMYYEFKILDSHFLSDPQVSGPNFAGSTTHSESTSLETFQIKVDSSQIKNTEKLYDVTVFFASEEFIAKEKKKRIISRLNSLSSSSTIHNNTSSIGTGTSTTSRTSVMK